MSTVYGARLPSLHDRDLEIACETLVGRLEGRLASADRFAIVPDAHYPHHPSTGLVTNPALVQALAGVLSEYATDPTVDVVVPAGGPVQPPDVGGLLGYDGLAASGPVTVRTLHDPDDTDGHDGRRARDGPEAASRLSVDTLADRSVVVVPSVRPDRGGGVAGAQATLTRAVGGDPTAEEDVQDAHRAISAAACIADATYVYADGPYRAEALLGSARSRSLDHVIASLLSLDVERAAPTGPSAAGEGAVDVRGVDVEDLRRTLPDAEPISEGGPGRLVRSGYWLYTLVSGDVYPPHFRSEG